MMMIFVVALFVIEQEHLNLMMIIEIELVVVEMMFERHLMLHIETQHELVELNYITDVLNVKLGQILKLNNNINNRPRMHIYALYLPDLYTANIHDNINILSMSEIVFTFNP